LNQALLVVKDVYEFGQIQCIQSIKSSDFIGQNNVGQNFRRLCKFRHSKTA